MPVPVPFITNVASQCTIEYTNWDTPPANPERAVDGNLDTYAGTAQSTLSSAGTAGRVRITFPSKGVYLVGAVLGLWSDDGSHQINGYGRYENTFRYIQRVMNLASSTSERIVSPLPLLIGGTGAQYEIYVNTATTVYLNIYEIFVYKLRL